MEALAGGRAVSEIDFDIIFTSRLVRAKQTALIAMTQVCSFSHSHFSFLTNYSLLLRTYFFEEAMISLTPKWYHLHAHVKLR